MTLELSLDEEVKLIQVKERMSFSGRWKSISGEKKKFVGWEARWYSGGIYMYIVPGARYGIGSCHVTTDKLLNV